MKKLIPALCMLLIVATLLGTSTYAWFSMNTTVTATGMQVQAKAEAGLIISNATSGTYNVSASSAKADCAVLLPGSTSDLTNWFHSSSTNPAAANTEQAYDEGVEWVDNDTPAHYVVHNFYIKSSSYEAFDVASLDIKSVEAKVGTAGAAQNLSKALRIGVKIGNDFYIYAPVTGYTASYTVTTATGEYSADARETVAPLAGTTVSNDTTIVSIPGSDSTPITANVYAWFEGEDENCISNNIVDALESLTITVTFTYTAPSAEESSEPEVSDS